MAIWTFKINIVERINGKFENLNSLYHEATSNNMGAILWMIGISKQFDQCNPYRRQQHQLYVPLVKDIDGFIIDSKREKLIQSIIIVILCKYQESHVNTL